MSADREIPRGDLGGFVRYLRHDAISGFLVFLIALPLGLAISIASGFPPIAGIFTAIVGAFVVGWVSNSELTIKGPAAGLIVIVLGCVQDFGGDGTAGGFTATDMTAYRCTLAVGATAAVLQIVFGVFRAGIVGEFFPTSAVHGMLAAIGVIIISKQVPVALGVDAKGDPLSMLMHIPSYILEANPAIAIIGLVSLLIMFAWPRLVSRLEILRLFPAQLIVLAVAIPIGMGFDLLHPHSFTLQNHKYPLGEQYLVQMPDRMFGMFDSIQAPDFSALAQPKAWKWVFMFFIIGTLESLLSAKAIDSIDPWKRRTNFDRDVIGIGIANLGSALVGGLPMISEIVRSKANIDSGARTRFSNSWHGMFLLVCVSFIPMFLHRIPLAALAAMLIYTGFRLAHPNEFRAVYRVGREQLLIFASTIVGVLATDLLIGIGIGIAVKIFSHVYNGVPLTALFHTQLDIEPQEGNTCLIRAHHPAVFTNWIPFRKRIEDIGLVQRQNIILDLSDTRFIDHSVMDRLHELEREFEQEGLKLTMIGLESHRPLASHAQSARKRVTGWSRRLTIVADRSVVEQIEDLLAEMGIQEFTVSQCHQHVRDLADGREPLDRLEILVSKGMIDELTHRLRRAVVTSRVVSICMEAVDVVSLDSPFGVRSPHDEVPTSTAP